MIVGKGFSIPARTNRFQLTSTSSIALVRKRSIAFDLDIGNPFPFFMEFIKSSIDFITIRCTALPISPDAVKSPDCIPKNSIL
jgi:hypothetical protein